jgi:Domain of unknown function (DUF955).
MSAKDNKLKPLEIDIKNKIEQFLGVSKQAIDEYVNRYNTVMDIPYQYLAHIIRTLETYIRKKEGFGYFRITCTPTQDMSLIAKNLSAGFYNSKASYDIFYDECLPELQKRIAIAHELGHLFFILEFDKDETDTHEPLSSLFGVITMLHKFQMARSKEYHSSEEDIIRDFKLLMNRQNGIFNISD